MSRKRIPRRIRKQEWKRLGFKSPSIMRRFNESMSRLRRLLENVIAPIARSFNAMANGFAKMTNLDSVAANIGLERMIDESDEELRARIRATHSWTP